MAADLERTNLGKFPSETRAVLCDNPRPADLINNCTYSMY
jgi:hypothetical protein